RRHGARVVGVVPRDGRRRRGRDGLGRARPGRGNRRCAAALHHLGGRTAHHGRQRSGRVAHQVLSFSTPRVTICAYRQGSVVMTTNGANGAFHVLRTLSARVIGSRAVSDSGKRRGGPSVDIAYTSAAVSN